MIDEWWWWWWWWWCIYPGAAILADLINTSDKWILPSPRCFWAIITNTASDISAQLTQATAVTTITTTTTVFLWVRTENWQRRTCRSAPLIWWRHLSTCCSVPERRRRQWTSVQRRQQPITCRRREKMKTSARCHWQRAPRRPAKRSNRSGIGRVSLPHSSANWNELSARRTIQTSSCAKNSR